MEQSDEWIILLGGSGTVGHFTIQLARLCGFKVAASCSTSKSEVCVIPTLFLIHPVLTNMSE